MPFISGGTAPDQGPSEKPLTSMASDLLNDTTIDPFSGISDKKRFNTGSLVLIVVIVAACGMLWFMRSLTKAGAADIAHTQVEASVEKFINDMNGKSKQGGSGAGLTSDTNVLTVLSGSYAERQVPLDAVQRNPFILFDDDGATTRPEVNDGNVARRYSDRRSQFDKAAAKFELKSVLMGTQPLANISGKIVRMGDEIVSQPDHCVFRVSEITKEYVTLIGEDSEWNISLPVTIVIKR